MSKEYKDNELCKNNRSQAVENVTLSVRAHPSRLAENESTLNPVKHNDSSYNFNEDEGLVSYRRTERSFDNDVLSTDISSMDDSFDSPKLRHKTSHNPADVDHYVNDAERDNATSTVIPKRHHNICSTVSDFYCRL